MFHFCSRNVGKSSGSSEENESPFSLFMMHVSITVIIQDFDVVRTAYEYSS